MDAWRELFSTDAEPDTDLDEQIIRLHFEAEVIGRDTDLHKDIRQNVSHLQLMIERHVRDRGRTLELAHGERSQTLTLE